MRPGATKRIVVTGILVTLLMVAGLGNQWIYKQAWDSDSDLGTEWYDSLFRILVRPLWIVDKGDLQDAFHTRLDTDVVVGGYVGIVAMLVVVALVLVAGARGLGERAGGFAAFLLGWFSLVLGGALLGLVSWAIASSGEEERGERGLNEFDQALEAMRDGSEFGLFCGWIVGLAAVAAYAISYPMPPGAVGAGGYGPQANVYNQPTAYNPAYGAPPASPAYGGRPQQQAPYAPQAPQAPHEAPTTIRPAGPPPSAPPYRPGSTDTPPGGFRP